ncbi:hypothetical protein [Halioglobus sp. Uisw_031]|uniref:hypothetical protein n=1 Tax=Halioglobus sp. Uisw_031 TaxID=3230977 RepID=UPI0039ED0BFB
MGFYQSRQSPHCEYVFLLAEEETKTEDISVAGEVYRLSSAAIDIGLIRSVAAMLYWVSCWAIPWLFLGDQNG